VVTTVLTRMVARLLLVPVLMVAAAILVKGYVDVGDGFAAGVVAALGVLLQYLAFGRAAVERVLPVRHAAKLAIGGLLVTLAVAFVPALAGQAPLQHAPAPGAKVTVESQDATNGTASSVASTTAARQSSSSLFWGGSASRWPSSISPTLLMDKPAAVQRKISRMRCTSSAVYKRWPPSVRWGRISPWRRSQARSVTGLMPVRLTTSRMGSKSGEVASVIEGFIRKVAHSKPIQSFCGEHP